MKRRFNDLMYANIEQIEENKVEVCLKSRKAH